MSRTVSESTYNGLICNPHGGSVWGVPFGMCSSSTVTRRFRKLCLRGPASCEGFTGLWPGNDVCTCRFQDGFSSTGSELRRGRGR